MAFEPVKKLKLAASFAFLFLFFVMDFGFLVASLQQNAPTRPQEHKKRLPRQP